jgi:hypothetical protein
VRQGLPFTLGIYVRFFQDAAGKWCWERVDNDGTVSICGTPSATYKECRADAARASWASGQRLPRTPQLNFVRGRAKQ